MNLNELAEEISEITGIDVSESLRTVEALGVVIASKIWDEVEIPAEHKTIGLMIEKG